jgi:hypothetical protein
MSGDRSRLCAVVLAASAGAVAVNACARVLQRPVQQPSRAVVRELWQAPRDLESFQDERTRPKADRGHNSYVLPAVEIVAMDAVVNLAGRLLLDPATFEVTPATIRRNLRGPWVVDDDPFQINQVGHPYQGAMYHGIARSNGLGYWPSAVYTFAGSALWEIAGETTPPFSQRSDCQRHRGFFSGRATLPHLPSAAGAS